MGGETDTLFVAEISFAEPSLGLATINTETLEQDQRDDSGRDAAVGADGARGTKPNLAKLTIGRNFNRSSRAPCASGCSAQLRNDALEGCQAEHDLLYDAAARAACSAFSDKSVTQTIGSVESVTRSVLATCSLDVRRSFASAAFSDRSVATGQNSPHDLTTCFDLGDHNLVGPALL